MNKLSVAVAVCCAIATNYVNAEVRINGFASIIGGKSLDSEQTIYGYDDDISFKNESVFALQLSADLQEKLTATAQIVARGDNDFDADFEWAYLTYQLNDEIQISAGKMRAPFYKYSDFLDVGYAYRWVRPPQSVYSIAFSTYEGLSLLYDTQMGDWDSSLQLIYGSYDGNLNGSASKTILNDFTGINWSVTRDWFSARVAYLQAESSTELSTDSSLYGLLATLNENGLVEQAKSLDIDEEDARFYALGFSIDYNDVLFDAEYTKLNPGDSLLPEETQYYASIGYRMDEIIVHFTYEDNDDANDSSSYDQIPEIPALNAAINGSFDAFNAQDNVYTIGVRYDFHPSAAFKIDFSRYENNITDTETDVVAVGVDLVF
ncbi:MULTISPECIES: porin [unclassified Pseudoalteromonas]|uniref:porin n=1 Tax=unclassified Pseudoalteromonas TaxID=194690 RepID=UPI0002315DA1|nr:MULTISPECIES: porin [unclassified Pseudoalteromonas]ATG76930.1 hypothetical protein AOR04_04855 [Pseudoalteromonas sp. 1_2015MBL_MicDiv]KDC53360.1 hypothetical protein DO88_13160 [Pseudoalteromonas sp. S3431]GAA79481.1 hypothetical protein P20495_1982 [Pseudoalteromonas sp. BSi20495]